LAPVGCPNLERRRESNWKTTHWRQIRRQAPNRNAVLGATGGGGALWRLKGEFRADSAGEGGRGVKEK
jgi:hypothetical protein